METKKGKITEIGNIEITKNGHDIVHLSIQIGVTKTYDRFSGQEQETPEEVCYTLFHEDARSAADTYHVGDVVELTIDHYVNRQWHRTETICRQLKLVKRSDGQPASTKEQLIQQQAEKNAAAPQSEGDELPF